MILKGESVGIKGFETRFIEECRSLLISHYVAIIISDQFYWKGLNLNGVEA